MKLAIFQHAAHEAPGRFIPWAASQGFSVSVYRLDQGEPLPDPAELDGVIVLGGPMNVDDHTGFPWLAEEKAWLSAWLETGKLTLGICLGAQLLARCLGAHVTQNPQPEIGWFPVKLTPEAQTLPVFKGISPAFITFHWHSDTFELPDGTVPLAYSEGCPNQGFWRPPMTLGLQFHPEVNDELLEAFLADPDEILPEGPFVQTKTDMADYLEFYKWEMQDTFATLMENLMAIVLRPAPQASAG